MSAERRNGAKDVTTGADRDDLGAWIESAVEPVIADARNALASHQRADGHWLFELEPDVSVPAEFIMLGHFLDEIDDELDQKLASYLRETQADHGGWPLYYDGDFNISSSVKAYYALKLTGDDVDAPHMRRARQAILDFGGAARANVFTRIALALFGEVPWRAVPVMPPEIMLLPRWFPFHMSKVSYWSRTVIAPLLVLMATKPRAKNPRGIGVAELFTTPPERERHYMQNPTGSAWGTFFIGADKVLRIVEPLFPKGPRRKGIEKAIAFTTERLNGEDGLGAIYPAIANAVMAFETLGYPKDHPDLVTAKRSIRRLFTFGEGSPIGDGPAGKNARPYCQPCISPLWDTCLASHAMLEAEADEACISKAADWMTERQILDVVGDWATRRPGLRPGGWAFQYNNPHYPDVDDTAVVAMALHRTGDPRHRESIARAEEWVVGMQSKNGGWGAFDAENTHYLLNNIPFADHGALLDPPTADVTARCLSMLVQLGRGRDDAAVARAIAYLKAEQEPDGSWFGRWGTNYIYGTWSVLCALNIAGEDLEAPYIRKAVAWLDDRQREDGGWGEDGATYWADRKTECKESTPSQTAWALLGLMAAGEVESPVVRRGIEYLLAVPRDGSKWEEKLFTAIGFPRIFYLRYDGYSRYFPLWALSRYRNLMRGNTRTVPHGM